MCVVQYGQQMRNELKRIGLSDEEINIYLHLLREGSSKATTISKMLGVARTTIYRFLSSLHDKGLVSETTKNNVKYFGPTPPERIPEILQERVEEVNKILRGELFVIGSWNSSIAPLPVNEWKSSLDFMDKGKIKVKPLISHRVKLEDCKEVFEMMYYKKEIFNKVLFIPEL